MPTVGEDGNSYSLLVGIINYCYFGKKSLTLSSQLEKFHPYNPAVLLKGHICKRICGPGHFFRRYTKIFKAVLFIKSKSSKYINKLYSQTIECKMKRNELEYKQKYESYIVQWKTSKIHCIISFLWNSWTGKIIHYVQYICIYDIYMTKLYNLNQEYAFHNSQQ